MRIQTLINVKNNYRNLNNNTARYDKIKTQSQTQAQTNRHQYTGDACADLAYASLFDKEIAKDLKLMGLI